MSTALSLFSLAFADGLRPPPVQTISEWADANRVLGKPEPGPWRTERTPYLREPMDNMSSESPVIETVLVKGAQGGGTETGLNFIGEVMDSGRGDMLWVAPSLPTIKTFSRRRLAPLIEFTPGLRDKIAPARSRDAANTIFLKEFLGGTLRLAGANSAASLRSDPLPFLVLDEEDAYPLDLDGEGSPALLAIERTSNFADRKILRISTPTLAGFSAIWDAYLAGDQRHYFIPCPLCDWPQRWIWRFDVPGDIPGGVIWPDGEPDKAVYQCEKCGDTFEEWQKTELLKRGTWIPSAPGNGGGMIRSYQISAVYYPYGWPGHAWSALAAQWERDQKHPIRRKTFINLKGGEPYSDPEEAHADAAVLFSRRETYGPQVPACVAVLTFGADVQANRIEADLVGWGADEECWAIEYRVFPGDTSRLVDGGNSPWEALDHWAQGEWLSELGVPLGIHAGCIDSGYNTMAVTQFCSERARRRIWATKGFYGPRPVWGSKSRKQRGKYPPPVAIGVDTAKERVYAALKITGPGAMFCHFPVTDQHSRHYFEMLTSEVRVPDYTGVAPKFIWKKKNTSIPNEALDARVLALAALQGLRETRGLRLNEEVAGLKRLAESQAQQREIQSRRPEPLLVRAPSDVSQRPAKLGGRRIRWRMGS